MTHNRKVELLYRKAKGEPSGATVSETVELRRYRVSSGEAKLYATKGNISAYIKAVDNEDCCISFYDWCMNNNRADHRRKGSSEADMKKANRKYGYGLIFVGFFTWGFAVTSFAGSIFPTWFCILDGILISFVLGKASRKASVFTVFILPIIIGVLAQMYM